jgi:carbonyl reductase 1
MSTTKRIAAISGGNRGIGYEIARRLAQAGLHVIIGSRDEEAGNAAARTLSNDGFEAEALPLDVGSKESILAFVEAIRHKHGGLDVLVNNAGMSMDGFNESVARKTVDTNFYGTMHLTDTVCPMLRHGARIVMVSSGLGEVSGVSGELAAQFMHPELNRDKLSALVESFVNDVAAGNHREMGWPSSAYRVSKISMNAFTRIVARELATDAGKILVNTCCPGWVRTRMGGPGAMRSPEDGAKTPAWLALLPEGGPTGGFFRDEKPIPW